MVVVEDHLGEVAVDRLVEEEDHQAVVVVAAAEVAHLVVEVALLVVEAVDQEVAEADSPRA